MPDENGLNRLILCNTSLLTVVPLMNYRKMFYVPHAGVLAGTCDVPTRIS